MYSQNKHQVQTIDESKSSMYGSREKVKIELIKGTNLFQVTLIMKIGNVTENVIEILRKIKWLKSEYSKKKLSKERRLKSFLKNEYFKVSLNEVSRDLRLSETLLYSKTR